MAKVKVLKESELIGGTDNSSVYPITHTKAVFNSDNKELDQILTELEQQIASSSLSNFVLDLGIVKSKEEGEQKAARSEVAGNRNISFIRFQVQGVSTLKTTLIMQWPNGINETAQIMCVDKAQWRRNVTGATGVKGDPTNAYSWERTAPHYIDYNAQSRILQLKDYENQNVSRGVELPLATSTQHGLLSAADKTKLDNYPETPLDISTATSSLDGLMSAADKAALDTAKADIASMQSSKAEKTDLDAAKDEISKNARLIETLESSLESTDEKADTAMRILTFASTVENVNIEEQIISSDFSILYDIGRGCFVALKDGKYYSSFLGSENYNSIFGGVLKPREDRLFLSLDDNFIYHYDGTKLRYFAITNDERAKLLAYPAKPLDIPLATESSQGLMSAEDKRKINKETQPWTNIVWSGHNMNEFTEFGEYYIHGERTDSSDNLPILNAASGHTIEGILKVYDSSIAGTGKNTDKVVTQILSMSNRVGGDGHIWIRTGQGSTKLNLTWSTWEKLQGIFEKNNVTNLDDLDGYTTNGMYSGIYSGTGPKDFYTVRFLPGDTFLMITVNGYAVGQFGMTPQITQLLYKLPTKTSTSKQNAEIYLRTGSYNKVDKVWVWGNFTKMVTNTDLASQVAVLTAKINQNADKIDNINPTPMILVTYTELVALRDNGELVAGMQYRITDYVTTTAQENTRSAGHQFDVIVTADNENTLNEVARACLHEGDTYFSEAGANLAAWKIWYCINNDAERFAWADAENGKGVIYRMIDEWNNDVPYDFKNINFKRYIIEADNAFATNVAKGGEIDVVKAMLKEMSHKIHTDLWYYGGNVRDIYPDANPEARYVPFGDVGYEHNGPQVICLIDENNYGWFYTFHNEDEDASLLKPNVNDTIGVCDNTIKDSCYVFLVEEGAGSYYPTKINAKSLNNIVFFGNNCNSNSFGNNCNSNSFGNDCYYNSFGNNFNSNSFGNNCNSNSFGNNCYSNSFGNDCYSNSFGNNCYYNSFGNNCNSNSFGNNCYSNSFGNDCYSNSFGNNCYSNSFGNSCYSNIFCNDCYYNSFGNNCYSNSFGNNCNSIMFASDSSASTKYNYYQNNHFGDGCKYIVLKGAGDASYSKLLQNYNFSQGVQGTSSNYLNIDGVRNLSYETKVAKNSSGELKIYCEADLVQ